MSTTDDAVTWLTQDAYDRLSARARRADRQPAGHGARRSTTAAKRATSRRTAATTPPARSRASRRAASCSCRQLLRSAKVGEAPVSDGVAGPGMVVEVRFDGDDDVETFLIGSREEAETAGVEVYSAASPLGKALTGATRGRHRRVRDAQRQDDEGHAGQRQALRRLNAPAGARRAGRASGTYGAGQPASIRGRRHRRPGRSDRRRAHPSRRRRRHRHRGRQRATTGHPSSGTHRRSASPSLGRPSARRRRAAATPACRPSPVRRAPSGMRVTAGGATYVVKVWAQVQQQQLRRRTPTAAR